MITIRFATIADAELIADLSRQTFYETFASHNTQANMDMFMNEQFAKKELMKEIGEPGNIFLLAYEGDESVGYVRMRENNNPPELNGANAVEVARIYAVASAIGKGVGKMLMQQCIAIASQRGKDIIWLGVWEQNQRAIEFYNKWGFEKFGTHIFKLGNDPQVDWLMKKTVSAQ